MFATQHNLHKELKMKFKNKKIVNAIIAALVVSVTGCASIVGKSSYNVAIKSNPEGTRFIVKNSSGTAVHSGETPATVALTSKKGYFKSEQYTVTFSKEGYQEQTIPLSASLSGWYWGNILIGGLIGMLIVDPATGAMWKLPENIDAKLPQDNATALEDGIAPQLQVVAIDQIPDWQKAQLIKLN
jgi:hypothetical protein